MIAEDEAEARQGLRSMIEAHGEFEVVGESEDGLRAVDAIERLEPDVLFLDVQMPGLNGFEVLKETRLDPLPVVIFVTAYNRYALRAFDVHAVDFLLKPYSDERLEQTLVRAAAQVRDRRELANLRLRIKELLLQVESDAESSYATQFAVKDRGRTILIDVGEIIWIEAAGNYALLHLEERSVMRRATMSELESQLDPNKFLRVHRSAIVRIDRVRELIPETSGDCQLVLDNGVEVMCSRTYGDARRRVFGDL